MYNRYLAAAGEDAPPIPAHTPEPLAAPALAGLGRSLSDRLQALRPDRDMVIALVIVWFLLSDETAGEVDWEQLLLVGALLLLGV